jgi:predicted AAA+ superfamily ATPase
MYRFITKQLLEWKQSIKRKPLILQGARQVGKTFILKEFGRIAFENVIYCNFERDRELHKAFESSLDPHKLIKLLSAYFNAQVAPQHTLLIFDEIQECGPALTSLKYFFEEAPQYSIVSAGSLLGVTLAKQGSFPVGSVDFLSLEPLSFFEFVNALGKGSILKYLSEQSLDLEIPAVLTSELTQLLTQYQFVGGMPEAVRAFTESNALDDVRKTHEAILKSYVSDFAKHAPREEVANILSVWEVIPAALGRENKKFVVSLIKPGARLGNYERAILWLTQAGVLRQVKRVGNPQRPLRAHEDAGIFKLYSNDVGLLATQMNIPSSQILSPDAVLGEFSGAIAECFVAQELSSLGFRSLYYWCSQGSAEVDFILEYEEAVAPLEVKAGHNVKSKSLTAYVERYHPKQAFRTSLKNIDRSGEIFNCPLYALPLLQSFAPHLNGAGTFWKQLP